MKKSVLLLTMILLSSVGAAQAVEPLLLEPLQTVLSSSPRSYDQTTTLAPFKTPIGGGVYEATFMPATASVGLTISQNIITGILNSWVLNFQSWI